MRYIEKELPIKYLNILAMREGNSKKPIYQMHKWWARRLSCVFRMMLLASFSSADENESSLWNKFYQGADFGAPLVLDPFMGGGTTIVEALRLGCRVIGMDINPVAWFVTKKEIEPVDLEALDSAFEHLEKTAGRQIREFYQTRCTHDHQADIMYVFWIKQAQCADCGTTVDLFPYYWVDRRRDVKTMVCPDCLHVFSLEQEEVQTVTCPCCDTTFDPAKGVSGYGKFTCSQCGMEDTHLNAVARRGGALPLKMFGLEYYCPTCESRGFKAVDEEDRERYEEIKAQFEAERDYLLFPRQAIPTKGRSDPRPVNHGYTHFWQMFNERQLLSLSTLLNSILQIEDENIQELLLLAFSDCLDANNLFCKYEVDYHKISLLFGLHAYHPIERPTENNVWGTRYGRGTFRRCYQKMRRGKVYGHHPYERRYSDGKSEKIFVRGEKVNAQLSPNLAGLSDGKNALLVAENAERMGFIPDEAVDAVITDPPYFDNVMYSELADFFYVWLRLGLKDRYPCFEPELSSRRQELVQNEKEGKTERFFAQGLGRVFEECHRVLKPDGFMVFTFHHTEESAWTLLARTLIESGFYVSAAPVTRSEGKSGFHSDEGNIKYDVYLVCRKRSASAESPSWERLKHAIRQQTVLCTRRIIRSGMKVNSIDLFAVAMGKLLETYCRYWPGVRKQRDIEEAVRETAILAKDLDHIREMPEMTSELTPRFTQLQLLERCEQYGN
jgi:adenine-specific DNA methylase